jgi:mono/diheme cytochrome c family protein
MLRSDPTPTLRACAIVASLVVALATQDAAAQTPADDFRQNCMSCHTIGGGRLTGPDLKDVTTRKERAWLTSFIVDPKAKFDAGDPYAMELKAASQGAVMPNLPNMTSARAEALLVLIEEESKNPASPFKGTQVSERPLTAADVARGRDLFTGAQALRGGGPACIGCHTTNDIGAFGGGVLGPDLSAVLERYGGRRTLSTWLSAPALPTMRSVYATQPLEAEEILALVAYFQSVLARSPRDPSTARLNFILLGVGVLVLVLALLEVDSRRRLHGVRLPLVAAARAAVHARFAARTSSTPRNSHHT